MTTTKPTFEELLEDYEIAIEEMRGEFGSDDEARQNAIGECDALRAALLAHVSDLGPMSASESSSAAYLAIRAALGEYVTSSGTLRLGSPVALVAQLRSALAGLA